MSYSQRQSGELETEQLRMPQKERDRLVVLKKAKDGLITQKQAATEIRLTERQVRRLPEQTLQSFCGPHFDGEEVSGDY